MTVYFCKVEGDNGRPKIINLTHVQWVLWMDDGALRVFFGPDAYADVTGESARRLESMLEGMATDTTLAESPDSGDDDGGFY
jgi:hypothetical protein